MSAWQVAIFAGLALIVVGGFAWYERTRPTARLVALVAALAALAVAGRLVLAPIPNVVATTDIVLITGYALGAAPGFAVGALAAPVSNIWLGQGPWTAWQMAGWGLVGLAGAWLAIASRRRLGRLGLAVACAGAGLAYGALLDLSTMMSYGGEQSLDRYLALSARGVPFNVAHAAGNFALALAAGPALVRMISRYRTRSRFDWHPEGVLPLLLVVAVGVAAFPAAPARAQLAPRAAVADARAWLEGTQNSDGGFGATRDYPSSPAMTGWVMLGLEAAGSNPLDLRRGGETPVSYLRSQADRLRSDGDLERTILALAGAGLDPRRFGGADLVSELRSRRDANGSVGGQVNLTAFYALAMRAAGADPGSLGRSTRWLRHAQNPDGGWGIQPGAPSEADSTGAALQGLAVGGSGGRTSSRGARWLRAAQRGGGGYALATTGVVNSQSTAWAVQGTIAAGGSGGSVRSALGYLARLRSTDGHYRYSPTSDQTPVWVTAQVVLALERQPFPVPAVARAARSAGGSGQPGGASGGGSREGSTPAANAQAATATGAPSSDAGSRASGGTDPGAGSAATTDGGPTTVGGGSAASRSTAGSAGAGGDAEAGASDQAPAAGETVAAEPVTVLTAPAERSGDDRTRYLVGGVAVLAVGLAAGFIWYRRRGV